MGVKEVCTVVSGRWVRSLSRIGLVTLCLSTPVFAVVPGTINYQGYLTSASGTPLNGPTVITFRIYDDPLLGSPLWSETRSVAVANGVYSIQLGSVTPLSGLGFDVPYWLGVEVGSDGEMAPRQAFTKVPYAANAETAEYVAWQNVGGVPPDLADGDQDTTYTAGTGIDITGGVVSNTGDTNGADDLTTSTSFAGDVSGTYNTLTLGAGSVGSAEIDSAQVQKRVSGTCPTGSSIRVVNADGTVTCETDSNTTYAAGTGIDIAAGTITNTGDTNAADDVTVATSFGGDVSGTSSNLQLGADVVGTAEVADGSLTEEDLLTPVTGSGTATEDTEIRRFYLDVLNGVQSARVKVVCNGEGAGATSYVTIFVDNTVTTTTYGYTCSGGGARPYTYFSPAFAVSPRTIVDVKYRVMASGGGRFYWREVGLIPDTNPAPLLKSVRVDQTLSVSTARQYFTANHLVVTPPADGYVLLNGSVGYNCGASSTSQAGFGFYVSTSAAAPTAAAPWTYSETNGFAFPLESPSSNGGTRVPRVVYPLPVTGGTTYYIWFGVDGLNVGSPYCSVINPSIIGTFYLDGM